MSPLRKSSLRVKSALLLFLIFLAGCGTTAVPVPVPVGNPPATTSVDDFTAQLMLALVERNYPQLQQMMSAPFHVGYWRSEGAELPPAVAIAQLRNDYLTPNAAVAFNTTQDLTALLAGMDPLTMWGPDVNAVKALYLTGLGADRKAAAILVIALDDNDEPYWHGMLVTNDGFGEPAPEPQSSPASTATSTSAPAATPTNPPTATPPPVAGIYPTEVRLIRVLQNVNIRNGPGIQFARLGRYTVGQIVDVFGTNRDRSWWNVRCPDGSVNDCWVTAEADTTQPTSGRNPTPTLTPTTIPGDATPIRIDFPPGGTSATVRGNVRSPLRVRYLVRALAGQDMTVELFSPTGQANFAIQGVSDGQPYKRLENEDRSFTFRLPASQDYLITVATTAAMTPYELRVTVLTPEPPPVRPTRIQFPPGGTSATVNGLVRPPERPQYVLKALAGQEMTVQIVSPGNLANFAITGVSDGQPYKRLVNEDRSFTFRLPLTQDYLITVASAAGAVDFALTVTVVAAEPPPPPVNEPVRIRFAPGAISATVNGSLVPNERQDYLAGASAGQTMTVELYASADNTLLAITGEDGTPYKRGAVGGPYFSFELPATQDYIISVISEGVDTDYSLVVTIE